MKEYKINLESLRGKNGMNDFEVMFILQPFDEEEKVQEVEDEIEKFIVDHGGKIEKTDSWGKKRLAYEILDYNYGYYYLITFKMSEDGVKELHEYMKSERGRESVLRHMIIRKGE